MNLHLVKSLEKEKGWNLCSICRNLRSIPSSWVQRCSSRKNFKRYTLQIVPGKCTIATIHETTWQRCEAQAKREFENLKVVEPIGDLGWGIPAFQLGHFNQTAFHLYQMAMIIDIYNNKPFCKVHLSYCGINIKTTKILETHISQLQGVYMEHVILIEL